MRNRLKKFKLGKRTVSLFLAAVLFGSGIPAETFQGVFDFITIKAEAANKDDNPSPSNVALGNWYNENDKVATISNLEDLIAYSKQYYLYPEDHYQDKITLNITGDSIELDEFYGLGNEYYPFEGILELNTGSQNPFWLPEAFFDHISTKAKIQEIGSTNAAILRIARIRDNTGEPIFAKHIHSAEDGDSTPIVANWNIEVDSYNTKDDNGHDVTYNYNNAGIIGEVCNDAQVTLSVTDNSSANIAANSVTKDVGYICGKMGLDSKLTVSSITGANNSYSITASSGNAGGIVGFMDDGSELTLNCEMRNLSSTITTTHADSYAGGLAGRNDGGKIVLDSSFNTTTNRYDVGGTVSGQKGAGGLFGYYRPVFAQSGGVYSYTYDMDTFNITASVNGVGSVGGLFGVLENKQVTVTRAEGNTPESRTDSAGGNITINGTQNFTATYSDGVADNFGGLIGYYSAYSMNSALSVAVSGSITANKTGGKYTNFGGVVGAVSDYDDNISNSHAYMSFSGITVSATGVDDANFGGLVGSANSSFVDVSGTTTITASGYKGGGIVGKFDDGVLQLAGTTDLSATSCAQGGQIVNERDSTLIYAESGWSLTRSSPAVEFDDIGSWGEVLRFSHITKSNVISDPNATTHKIQIVKPVTTIDSVEDFAVDSICFSIQVGRVGTTTTPQEGEPITTYDGNPWLIYPEPGEGETILNHESIVITDLTLDASFSLAQTGLTGLTRDSGDKYVTYSGTFDGGDKTLTLAIGDTVENGFNGYIYRHDKNGLFGVLSSRTESEALVGGTVTNLCLAGTVNVKANTEMCVGALAAQANGKITATDINVSTVFKADGDSKVTLGRLIGSATITDTINVKNTAQAANNHYGIDYGKYTGNITGANSGADSCFGGVIGKISSSVSAANTLWNITGIEITTVANDDNHNGKIENTSSKENQKIGGLVAVISNSKFNKVTLTLKDITINGVKLNETATKTAGGLLGYSWTNTNVNVNSVSVTDGIITLSGSGADLGGIIYKASGKWTIPSGGLNMDGAVIDAQNAGSFGMIVNHGGALYLLLTATDSFDCSSATLTNLKSNIVFDELVAYSVNYVTDSNGVKQYADEYGNPYILKNGNGIVSIKTSNLNMSGSGASNSYQAQTSRGNYMNKWTRYYYNLDAMTGANASQKLMLWGVHQYAHKDLKAFFSTSGVFEDGANYDMTGYSWYPVDLDSTSVNVRGTFKFANNEFETCEGANGGTNSSSKSSLSQTQHYMMHEGLFRNVTNSTITIDKATTWQGTISKLNTPYNTNEYGTGALVFGTIKGSRESTSKLDSSKGSIILDGIKVCNVTLTANGAYAPLIINEIGDYTLLTIKHVYVKNTAASGNPATCSYNNNGVTEYAATSLIGNAGLSGSASNINFEFGDIRLDGRSGTTPSGLPYPTTHSIFTKATLLNQFIYASESDATYNFTNSEDWTDASNHASYATSGVTYGSELSTPTSQFYGEEHWYKNENHDATGKLTSPENGNLTGGATSAYDFSAFIPYVAIADTKTQLEDSTNTEKKHQIRVNHGSATLSGCGTYNDPYMLTNGDIEKVALVINNANGAAAASFSLPDVTEATDPNDPTTWEDATNLLTKRWDTYGDHLYIYDSSKDKFRAYTGSQSSPNYIGGADGTDGYSVETVRKYLAGAYYKLSEEITIPDGYAGLGATVDSFAVFRGVIVGGGVGKKTIINKSDMPLIAASHGSVVKDIDIVVQKSSISKAKDAVTTYQSNNSNEAYGSVIGMIFGGDNIIDGVTVSFSSEVENETTHETETVTITVGGTHAYLVPVGGYVGVLVNGALIFRGMEGYRTSNTDKIEGLTNANVTDTLSPATANMVDSTTTRYLYVNPIIGRVLNGYVVTETTAYRPFENGVREYPDGSKAFCMGDGSDVTITMLEKSNASFASLNTTYTSAAQGVTMKNGTKNYSIADIDTSDTLSITAGSYETAKGNYKKTKVTLLDGQAVFLLGALIQSQATKNLPTATENLVASVSYGPDTYKTTHVATYERIGEANTAGTAAPASGHPYNDAINDGWSTSAKPYVAGKYTSGGVLAVTNSYSICNIQLGADSTPATSSSSPFRVPDGFKGLGGYLTNDNCLSLFEFNGQNNTISMDSKLQYYRKQVVYNQAKDTDSANLAIDNYLPALFGFGFFNCLRQNRENTGFDATNTQTKDAYRIHDVTLSGNIKAQVYQTNGAISGYDFGSGQRDNHLSIVCVGGLCGLAGNVNKDKICINKVHLNNLSVFGAKTVGGLIGYINTNTKEQYVYECDADKLKVEAGQEAGGIVGVVANTNFYLDGKVNASQNVAVKLISVTILSNLTGGDGGDSTVANDAGKGFNTPKNRAFYAGGVIGRSKNAITINDIDVGVLTSNYSGFIGNIDRSNDTLNELSKDGDEYNGYSFYRGEKRYYNSSDKPWSIVGGVIGAVSSNNNALTVTNCNVYNISTYGGFGGGIAGRPEGTATMNNCSVSSTQTTEQMEATETTTGKSSYMITGWYSVGGLVGEARAANTFDGCNVSNYVIRCYSEENDCNNAQTGGLTGRSKSGAAYIRNCSVVNCYLEGRGKSSGDNDTHEGIGGLVGINDEAINGYNILIKDIKLLANNTSVMDTSSSTPFAYTVINTSDNKRQNGYVCGASTSGKILKIIGFSLQVTDSTNNTISDPWYSTAKPDEANSYFINADYNCACDDDSTRSKVFANVGLPNVEPKKNVKYFIKKISNTWADFNEDDRPNKPYVTTSPKKYIDPDHFLTGDGVYGSGYNSSIAKTIVSDAIGAKPTGYYQEIKLSFPGTLGYTTPGSYALDSKPTDRTKTTMEAKFPSLYANNGDPTYGEIYLKELEDKLTTFQTATERKTSVPQNIDFPVLVLDDSNRYNTTELLNNYIRILTNTDYNYATTNDAYAVRFGKCKYDNDEGEFTITWGTTNDKYNTNPSNLYIATDGGDYFRIRSTYDNEIEDGQFTLVDVQYKIPAAIDSSTNYIAYHLYIPVVVKKMLKVDFEVSSLSGTEYRVAPYEGVRKNVLLENLETPVTLQFRWVYKRDLTEWVNQIAGGESLLQAFTDKKLNVNENNLASANVSGKGFPTSDMVLIDANNYNKPYYATTSIAYSSSSGNGTLDLSKFTDDGVAYNSSSPTNTKFTPVNFNEFFDITVSETEPASTETNVVKCTKLSGNSSDARIKVENDYYRPWEDGDTGTPYYLTFAFKEGMSKTFGNNTYLVEDYYISIFTKKETLLPEGVEDDTSFYHMVFSSPASVGTIMPNDVNSNNSKSPADVFLGGIFSTTFNMTESAPSELCLDTSTTSFSVAYESTISVAADHRSSITGYLSGDRVSIYQSFLINFHKYYLNNGSLLNIKGVKAEPNVTVNSYLIDTLNASGLGVTPQEGQDGGVDVTNQVKPISVDNGTLTTNYIELRTEENLTQYLKLAPGGITIKSSFTLNYSGNDEADTKHKITEQFALRDTALANEANVNLTNIGTKLLGSSNISSSATSTATSKTFKDDTGSTMYYTELRSGVSMLYASDDSANINGIYAQLGINPWNSTESELPIKTLITYNVKNVEKSGTATRMDLTLKLYKKGSYEVSGSELPIADYIDVRDYVDEETNPAKLIVKDKNGNAITLTTNNTTSYLYQISTPMTTLDYDSVNMVYSIPIDFSVYTGVNNNFENAKDENDASYKYYSNYMVKAEITLYNADGEIVGSQANDHVIYSNAKIHSDWITGTN